MPELDQRNQQHRKAHDLGEFIHKELGGVHRSELASEDSTDEPNRKRLVWITLSNDGLKAAVGTYYAGDKFELSLSEVLRGGRKSDFEHYFNTAVYENLLEVAAAMKGGGFGS
jgi:hypothetical protein